MGEKVENKNIANLEFNTKFAEENLKSLDKALKEIADNSKLYSETISKNLNAGFGNIKLIDANSVKTDAKKVVEVSKEMKEKIQQNDKVYARNKLLQDNKLNNDLIKQNNQLANQQILNNDRVAKSTESLYDKITQYAKTYVIYQGFNELKKGISETIDEMVEMEQQMVGIDRVLNESGLDIDNYRDKLIQLAHDYGNAFNNVADITLRLAQAGFSSNEAIALTEKTLLALNTAELNATQATDDMVAVMAQWGLMTGSATEKARNYGEIIDKINKVADNYPTTSADIMDALKKVSSAFNLAGASIDETIATIVAAEKASQRGGKVIGTALSNIVQQIKAEGKLNLAEQLGLDFFEDDAKTKFKPIMEIFQEMADRMEKLKSEGKESSVEMQNLLELFTVFRRNIGASLLGEMSGEDSTYLNVLNDSLTAVGYSLQENEKYMKTAKAAQAQFNAELLKLKTEVWDNGLEAVFRDMLSIGTDVVKGIEQIINKFGILPTTIGTVVAAYTALSGKVKVQNIGKLVEQIKAVNQEIQITGKELTKDSKVLNGTSNEFKKYATSINTGKASLVGYVAQTALATAGTIALNAAISLGLSAAITLIVSAIDKWTHAQENAIKKSKELQKEAEDNAQKYSDEKEQLQELRKEYEELAKKDNRTTEENQKIYELQTQINNLIKDTGKQVDLVNATIDEQGKRVLVVNEAYENQLKTIKAIEYERKRQETEELKKAMEQAKKIANENAVKLTDVFNFNTTDLNEALKQAGIIKTGKSTLRGEVYKTDAEEIFKNTQGISEQIKLLEEWIAKLNQVENPTKKVQEATDRLGEKLSELKEIQKNEIEATEKYIDSLGELYTQGNNLSSFQTAIKAILDTYGKDEGVKNIANSIQELNEKFANGNIKATEYFNNLRSQIDGIKNTAQKDGEEISAGMQAIFAETTRYLAEGIEATQLAFDSGTITFYEYGESLAQANQGLLELYATQNDLTYNAETGEWFNEQKNQVDDYANSLQNATDTVSEFSRMLQGLGESYDYIAKHATEAGEANFQMEDITSKSYQNLANNFADSLARMRNTNYETWSAITKNIFESTGKTANEVEDVDNHVKNALLKNSNNLNMSLTEANKMAQQAASDLGNATGQLIQNLGKVIENFDYTIKFETTGGINPGGNLIDLAVGKTFKPTSNLALKITGVGGDNVQTLATSLSSFGEEFGKYVSSATYNQYRSLLQNINPYTSANSSDLTDTRNNNTNPSSPRNPGGSGGTSSSSSARDTSVSDAAKAAAQAQKEAEQAAKEAQKAAEEAVKQATKEEEDEYKKRLAAFKDYMSERERLEKRWVDKQKELGQLSTKDYLAITQLRIERYKGYLQEIEKATWLHEEDRLALQKTYTEKIEDLQVDYFGYLKDQLEEEIDALKKANEERINSVKDEADARIAALRKVEAENDRIRTKEEYEKKRKEHLDDISYWEQRTGREAQEALKKAKENLKELDEQWEQQMEDWSIEDQIKAIEEERDAQVKAIEDAQEAEIAAMQAVYDAKVKAFAETGKLIYESSTMQSKALYESYKDNFIIPVKDEIKKINEEAAKALEIKKQEVTKANENLKKVTTTTAAPVTTPKQTVKQEPVVQKQYETYTIQWGDTLTKIARRYGTTIQKIMEANPYVTNPNKIYAGKTLQIPKFHEGGIVGGIKEGFALLKPNEVILKPEWAEGINRLAKMAKQTNTINNTSTVVEVKGDLVKIEASIKNKTDADYLTRRVEKILKDKFNIKK